MTFKVYPRYISSNQPTKTLMSATRLMSNTTRNIFFPRQCLHFHSGACTVLAIQVPNLGLKIWDSKIWDFFNGKSPKFQVPILDLYCKHCTCRQQQRHKWRRLVLVAVAAYTTQVLTSCLLLVPADQSCAIVEPLVSSSGVAVQLLSPTWDEAAVAAAAVPATTSSTFPLSLQYSHSSARILFTTSVRSACSDKKETNRGHSL